MTSKLYHTILLERYLLSDKGQDEAVCCNLVIHDQEHLTSALLRNLCNRHIAFLLTFEAHLFESWRPNKLNALLYAIISLDVYGHVGNKKFVFIQGETSDKARNSIKEIQYFFSKQAEHIEFVSMPLEANAFSKKQGPEEILILNKEFLKQFFSKNTLLKSIGAIQQASVILIETEMQSTSLTYEAGAVSSVLETLVDWTITFKELQNENKLLEQRAKLYLDFIAIGKKVQQKEYYELLEWYRSEYEVLPLWYKRFGHLIKVIMGKRTFKSLFNR